MPSFGGKALNQEDLNAAWTISQLKKSNTQEEAGNQDQFTGQLVRGQAASRGKPHQPKLQEPQKLKTTEEALKAVEIDDLNIHALKHLISKN